MIGSLIVEEIINRELKASEDVVADVGDSIHAAHVVPPGEPLPAVLFYMAATSQYDGATELAGPDDINAETLQFDVVSMCKGRSHTPIRRAFRGQLAALSGREFYEVDEDGRHYQVTFTARGETPLTTRVTGDEFMKALGTRYDIVVIRSEV